jgi:hypothetical protein
MLRTLEIDLCYQNLIEAPPPSDANLYERACSGDRVTVETWRPTWIKNVQAARDHFGRFDEKSVGNLYALNRQKAAIVIGSGPSLKHSIASLKENAASEAKVLTVSCLHNFGYFEDEGFHADYYLSVDSGPIVISDVSEGRQKEASHYWEQSKGKKLIAYIGSDPKLFELWQGEVYLFNCLIPDLEVKKAVDEIGRFAHYVSCGGNALGACMYVAKAIMGSSTIHYVGADFCFDYNNQFHSYKTHYDTPGAYVVWPDVFGLPRKTWASYMNFKFWFDWVAMNVPGVWVNCSEGTLGAYVSGNLKHFQYKTLEQALDVYRMNERVFLEKRSDTQELLSKERIDLKELFSNASYERDIVLF